MSSDHDSSEDDIRDLADEPPTSINPYEILSVSEEATSEEVRKAYRKAALKHHPDKATGVDATTAKETFQKIAFAYAILSDPRRRKLYDATGTTSEVLEQDDDFDWADYFRARWMDAITEAKLDDFVRKYRGSEEERNDIIKAYKRAKGNMDYVYEIVMCSNVLENDADIRKVIQEAIARGEVEAYKAFTDESEHSKKRRIKKAQREKEEAEQEAQKKDKKNAGSSKGKKKDSAGSKADDGASPLDSLAMVIGQRQEARSAGFLAHMEAKYGGKDSQKPKRGKKRAQDEPSEDAFKAMGERLKRTKK